jgi:hypothetical protein
MKASQENTYFIHGIQPIKEATRLASFGHHGAGEVATLPLPEEYLPYS